VTSRAPVLVLGGGPSGLACAWELARAGQSVTVLEREPRAGGLCATLERDGWRFDLGGHRFVSSNADLARRVRELLGGELLERERKSVVLHSGRTFRYPLEAGNLVRSLGVRENARAFAGYLAARARQRVAPSPDVTFEDWVRARFGAPLYDKFFGPYTEKLWGIPAREISSEWAAQRIGLLHLGDAALRMMGLRQKAIRTYARRYFYPRLGMGQLFERLAEETTRLGARIVLGAEVVGLETSGKRVTHVRARINGESATFPCASVYATIPLGDVAKQLGGDAPRSRLAFRAIRFVNLMLRRRAVSPNTWMYVADPRYAITRIQEPRHRSPDMAPPGTTSLMLEIPCAQDDEIWSGSDADLVELVLGELASLGFDVRADVVGSFSFRVPHGYPIYRVGYEADRERLLAHVGRWENVALGGRQGLFRYIFLDAAMEMGELAAKQLLRGGAIDTHAIDRVRRERVLLEANALSA
jgi:protoporphyrinogen oxidase